MDLMKKPLIALLESGSVPVGYACFSTAGLALAKHSHGARAGWSSATGTSWHILTSYPAEVNSIWRAAW
jgi:hypothetical protein